MIESEKHFCRVNDGFTFDIVRKLCAEMERRISNKGADESAKYGNWYIQFRTFTYVRVFSFHGYPWKLPRYPSDKLLLLELCRQIVQVTWQFGDRCLDFFKFLITISKCSCADFDVEKSAEIDVAHLQINTIGDVWHNFDSFRMISLIINGSYKHQAALEDQWENCVNEKQI